MTLDSALIAPSVDTAWEAIVPVIEDYIRIPAKSPAFDADWQATGHIAAAVELIRSWCAAHAPPDATIAVHELDGLTPVITIDVPAFGSHGSNDGGTDSADTVLLYGHLDKQPEMSGWRDGLGPWTPVLEGDRLYGRGGGDDGYAPFAIISAVNALRDAGGSHARCVGLIEASEESGSPDLPAHLHELQDFLGDVSLVICLDSGSPDYDALWQTTSLRGLLSAELRVDVLDNGLHSGLASGAVPSSFRILRQLLNRIEDAETGRILLDAFHTDVPPDRLAEAELTAKAGVDLRDEIAFAGSTRATSDDLAQLQLATTWEPTLSYVSAEGMPSLRDGGNVLRPYTTLGLSFRLPPTVDPEAAAAQLVEVIEADPPSGAQVTLTIKESAIGWNANPTEPWLAEALQQASEQHFGKRPGALGLGGTIPFMAMLGEIWPESQFVITGVLGPESNAHGPNEFLHLPTARKITASVANILDAHATKRPENEQPGTA